MWQAFGKSLLHKDKLEVIYTTEYGDERFIFTIGTKVATLNTEEVKDIVNILQGWLNGKQ